MPRYLIFALLSFWLFCTAGQSAVAPQRSPEGIGSEILAGLIAKDFGRLENMMPSDSILGEMMQHNQPSKVEPSATSPVQARAIMKHKIHADFEAILKSAKKHRIKLAKLHFGGIVESHDHLDSEWPMRALTMEIRYSDRLTDLTYTVAAHQQDWYFTGVLLSYDVFGQM
ncbi:MAG: hypothetical protein RLZZ519_748 [Bacteroidota bacterium]|jgi:hypothetical protein